MEIRDKESKERTEMMEKLNEENKEFRSKLQNRDRELKAMAKTLEKLSDENKSLSRKVEFLNDKVIKMEQTSSFGPRNDLVLEGTEEKISKRIVLHTDTDIISLVTTHSTKIQNLQKDVASLKNDSQTRSFELHKVQVDVNVLKNDSQTRNMDFYKLQTEIAALKTNRAKYRSGSTYVRWGRNNCSGNGTELVYSGYAAGSDFQDTGAAANYLCLSPDPLWGHYSDAHDALAKVMGVEYQLDSTKNCFLSQISLQ